MFQSLRDKCNSYSLYRSREREMGIVDLDMNRTSGHKKRRSMDHTLAVAAQESRKAHAPAIKLISPIRLSGIPMPFSTHQ